LKDGTLQADLDWCGTFTKSDKPPQFTENAHYYGGAVTPDPRDQARGWLQAIDATTGKLRWREQWPTPLVAGVTATSGGMLFTGDLNNDFLAIDASNGKTLYRFIPAVRSAAASSATRSPASSMSRRPPVWSRGSWEEAARRRSLSFPCPSGSA
jgi:outer membrane protein assembly factor BamB